jgi:hypothetical protein
MCVAGIDSRLARRINRAREKGYLDASGVRSRELLAAYSRWCWRLRLPVLWTERVSPHSRYGRMCLDLFTTPHRLTAEAQVRLRELASGAVTSPHDVRWERIAMAERDRLARAVLRLATSNANLQSISDYPVVYPASEVQLAIAS